MVKQIDVSDLPQPVVEALETIVRTYREQASLGAPVSARERTVGWLKGKLDVPDSFFEPLPDDLLDPFEGKGEGGE